MNREILTGVLTYDTNHLKTEHLLLELIKKKDLNLIVYALPFIKRKKRKVLFSHRPNMETGQKPEKLANKIDIPFRRINKLDDIKDKLEVCLVAGAGILPKEFVKKVVTINCHPGLIPSVRGLDAFKWAILDKKPLGITLHIIDKKIDSGKHLKSVKTSISKDDTIEQLAKKHYKLEIDLLANFREHLESPEKEMSNLARDKPRMRMPVNLEKSMLHGFEDYIKTFWNKE